MNILGLDLSMTETGYACSECGVGIIKSKPNTDRMSRWDYIASAVTIPHTEFDIHVAVSLVVIEGYAFGARSSQSHSLGELGGIVRHAIWKLGVPFVDISPASVKKYTTGKGNANKDAMLAAAIRRYGFEGDNNNEADAWMLLKMAQHHYSGEETTIYQAEALAKIDWPQIGDNR